jgi:hypothetical protein
MTDDEFFDTLLQLWAKTTGADDTYWDYEDTGETGFDIHSCGQDEERKFVGYCDSETDADFVTAIHGCLPDLIRRLYQAIDEAERLDIEMDVCQNRLAAAELRVMELEQDLGGLIG